MAITHRKANWVKGFLSSVVFTGAALLATPGFAANENVENITPPSPQEQNMSASPTNAPQQKQETKRQIETMTLTNGLTVHLTHDPDANNSAAALAVNVGFFDDPKDKAGMAHYLEHMLFLGTEKFPITGSYKKFLTTNGGRSNAYTTVDHTNYFFQIQHGAFDGALDRFSDFFKAPLFDTAYAAREVKAVDEEHQNSIRSDGWRKMFLKNQVSEPGHPISAFGGGSKETLGGGFNRDALLEFFNTHYSAKNMKLSFISNLPLSEQKELVEKHFAKIPGFEVAPKTIDPDYRKPLTDKYRLLEIEAVKDIRVMDLEFPTIRLADYNDSKPSSIISAALGNEGKGSLLSKLKEEGLAAGLSASGGGSHPDINAMSISVGLTPKGLENRERVLELIFSYIDMLKTEGMQKYTFDESSAMTTIHHNWKTPQEGMGYASSTASRMLNFDADEVLTKPFQLDKYAPDAYQKILDTMTPENMLVTVQAQGLKTDKFAPHYGTPYALNEIGGDSFELLANPKKIKGLTYPQVNPFIPQNLTLQKPDNAAASEKPHLVVDTDLAKVWSQFDTQFNQPKVSLSLKLETPLIYNNVDNFVRSQLLQACAMEGMSEQAYPLQSAGVGYGLDMGRKGVTIHVGGYTEKMDELIKFVSKNITACNIDEDSFSLIKDRFVRGLKNRKLGPASGRAYDYSSKLLFNIYADKEKMKAVESLTVKDIQDYAKKLFSEVRITGAAYGNWNDKDVIAAVDTLVTALDSKPLPEGSMPEIQIEKFEKGKNHVFSKQVIDSNNALLYMLQAGKNSPKRMTALQIVNSVISSNFYTELRSKKQMGYIVQSDPQKMEDSLFLNFMIQSSYGPVKVQEEVDAWKKDTMKLFDNLSDKELESHKESLAKQFTQKRNSLSDVQSEIFYFVTEENADFGYFNKLAEATRNLTREDVRTLAEEILTGIDTASLAIHIRSSNNDNAAPENAFTTVQDFKNRKKSGSGPAP